MERKAYDAAILGGGVIGCSIAYHLAKRGLSVVLIEKESLGARTSGGSPGMLAAQEEASSPGAFFEACVASREIFKTLVPEVREFSGIDPEWQPCGLWRLAESGEQRGKLLERKAWQERQGHRVEWLEAEEAARRLPALSGGFFGALHFPADGQINSAQWLRALAEAGRRRGARIVEHAAGAEIVFENGRAAGVRTEAGTFPAGAVIVAAGAWTPSLLSPFGVHFPLEPVKGQLLVLQGFPPVLEAPVYVGGGYLAPKADGRLIVGATQERGAGFDLRVTLAGQRQLIEWAHRWCPALEGREVLGFWAGLRPASSDGLPLMGPVPGREGLFVCAGHFRNGVLLSALSGAFMAEGVAESRWNSVGAAFAPARFPAGKDREAAPWR
jgi:glycine oxidase